MAQDSEQDRDLSALADTEVASGSGPIPEFALATGEPSLVPVDVDEEPLAAESERYESGPLLGAGGMGEVRLLQDRRIGRAVAMKTLLDTTDTASTRRRFLREARVQGQLEHPSVVPVYDLGNDEHGRPHFTMKRVRGETLSRIVDQLAKGDAESQQKYTRRRLLVAFTQVCNALHYAHVRGVVHRDLKPGNIMLGDYGEVYVLDWGVARVLKDASTGPNDVRLPVVLEASTGLTRQGDLVGSVGYMAPEQMDGDPDAVDPRADVFALGVVLFEILSLTRFRQQRSVLEAVRMALEGEVARPRALRDDVPPELDELCARCTARDRDARLQSARELADAIERFLDGDRDREMRRAVAEAHVAKARANVGKPIEATHDVVRALAFDPENDDAQRLLVKLVVEVSGPTPPEAEAEVQRHVDERRARGAGTGTFGFASMLLTFPLALWLGIRSWAAIAALTVSTLACALYATHASRHGARRRHTYVMAVLSAILVAVTSVIAGPFVIVPALAASIAMYFVVHVSPEERRLSLGIITLGALAPYAVELLGVLPPAYSFEPGRIVLHARGVEFPQTAALFGLAYTSIGFVALPALLAGWMHDELMRVQRQVVLQAWHLRRLLTRLGEGAAGE